MKKSIIYFTMLLLTACASKEVQQSAGFVTIQGADLIQPNGEKLFIQGTNLGIRFQPHELGLDDRPAF